MDLQLIITALSLTSVVILLAILIRQRTDDRTTPRLESLERWLERLDRGMREESSALRAELLRLGQQTREETLQTLETLSGQLSRRLGDLSAAQHSELETFSRNLAHLSSLTEQKLAMLRESVESRMGAIREETGRQLELMRATVDEKLQSTLETRLGESFRLVSERLEMVHRGLGEMQGLAQGVGDLKRLLSNVKIRGTVGEVQLEGLLEQILAPSQYDQNVATRPGSMERVEFAIRLPGPDDDPAGCVYLPIDAKFPVEDYLRLLDAVDAGDQEMAKECWKGLERRIRQMAADVRNKYLSPPRTTDFGILYLPTEGLYGEVLRHTGLVEELTREKIVVAGPTTLAALLNALQMGFRTLAIEKHSSEVWKLLGSVRTEFARFGEILDKTRRKLSEAQSSLDAAAVRSRAIERTLRNVEQNDTPLSLPTTTDPA